MFRFNRLLEQSSLFYQIRQSNENKIKQYNMSRRALMTLFQVHLCDDGANREDCIIHLFEFEWDEWRWPILEETFGNTSLEEILFIAEAAKNNMLKVYKKDFKAWDNVSWEAIEDELDRYIINKIKER